MYSLPQSYNQTSKCKRCISSNAYSLSLSFVFLFSPRKIGRRTATTSADMNICRTADSKGESSTQKFGLLPVYLLLRLEYGIDKLLVRDLAVEMSLGHIIVYLEFGVLKKFITDPCPDVERRIPIVGHVDSDKLCSG